jgi:diaminohydroxyphosphoribosylaminopyrimidine deaminase / 5-amino-6-(5-phosphoribosylamino)uracil reductase
MHEIWMQQAIEQARLGTGLTSPNPKVGAVIVKDGKLIGRGFHPKAGRPHAERFAIADALNRHPECLHGASIYVTLEPCSTTGRTPPCTDGIIEAGIKEVIYGSTDPNPNHQGSAKMILNEHGISVLSGVLETECDALIRDFKKRMHTGLPWVIAKTAMSLDGKISRPPQESQWLTSPESRELVLIIRSEVDAIIVGGRTLRKDNPSLTVRGKALHPDKQQPYRAIISHSDRSELPNELTVFTDAFKDRTLVFQDQAFEEILKDLAKRGCNSVLLECGGNLMGQWFDQGLVDECYVFLAPMITGGENLAVGGKGVESNAAAIRLKDISYRQIQGDVLAHGFVI